MTATIDSNAGAHHLDGQISQPDTAANPPAERSIGQGWLDYADTAFRQAPTVSDFTIDIDIAARLGQGYEMGRLVEALRFHAAVMADLTAELREARQARTAAPPVEQPETQSDFALNEQEAAIDRLPAPGQAS